MPTTLTPSGRFSTQKRPDDAYWAETCARITLNKRKATLTKCKAEQLQTSEGQKKVILRL